MDSDIINLLIQLPLLAFFAWWVYHSNKRWDDNNNGWREYLKERNSKLEKSIDRQTETIDKVGGAIEKLHDKLDR